MSELTKAIADYEANGTQALRDLLANRRFDESELVDNGEAALSAAVTRRDAELFSQLAAVGIPVWTTFSEIMWVEEQDSRQRLLDVWIAHVDSVNGWLSPDGLSPLHVAVAYERRDVVEKLLAVAADVNARDAEGVPVAVTAVESRNVDLLELIAARSDDEALREAVLVARDSGVAELAEVLTRICAAGGREHLLAPAPEDPG